MDFTISEAKTKVLLSCLVSMQLNAPLVLLLPKACFLMTQLILHLDNTT